MAPIVWNTRKQNTVESSTFGSEFVALKTSVETLRGVKYKLRMLGIPIDGATYGFGDNMSVVNNSSRPESTLKKKCNSIAYHAVWESKAAGEVIIAHEPELTNVADLLTKPLPGGQHRSELVDSVLYDI